jgi:hypothetical protein
MRSFSKSEIKSMVEHILRGGGKEGEADEEAAAAEPAAEAASEQEVPPPPSGTEQVAEQVGEDNQLLGLALVLFSFFLLSPVSLFQANSKT